MQVISGRINEDNMDHLQTREFLNLLDEGYGVANASRKLEIKYSDGYKVARDHGWSRKFKNKKINKKVTFGVFKQITLSLEEILERYNSGESQSSIAKSAGCSRERIRQIVIANGCQSAREKIKVRNQQIAPYVSLIKTLKKLIRKKNQAQSRVGNIKLEKDTKYWEHARQLWDQDIQIDEMCKILNMKASSFNWYIGVLRKKYGWFPNRKQFGRHRYQKASQEEKYNKIYNKYKSIIPLWNSGMTVTQICEELNVPRSFVSFGIRDLRRAGVGLVRRRSRRPKQ